jgi:GTP cyclohydrolase I
MSNDGNWQFVWFEELIDIAEHCASAPLYSVLKRPDEKHVTEQAYDNPAFVEDLVRSVAEKLKQDQRIAAFNVRSVNEESIHNHNAFAEICGRNLH